MDFEGRHAEAVAGGKRLPVLPPPDANGVGFAGTRRGGGFAVAGTTRRRGGSRGRPRSRAGAGAGTGESGPREDDDDDGRDGPSSGGGRAAGGSSGGGGGPSSSSVSSRSMTLGRGLRRLRDKDRPGGGMDDDGQSSVVSWKSFGSTLSFWRRFGEGGHAVRRRGRRRGGAGESDFDVVGASASASAPGRGEGPREADGDGEGTEDDKPEAEVRAKAKGSLAGLRRLHPVASASVRSRNASDNLSRSSAASLASGGGTGSFDRWRRRREERDRDRDRDRDRPDPARDEGEGEGDRLAASARDGGADDSADAPPAPRGRARGDRDRDRGRGRPTPERYRPPPRGGDDVRGRPRPERCRPPPRGGDDLRAAVASETSTTEARGGAVGLGEGRSASASAPSRPTLGDGRSVVRSASASASASARPTLRDAALRGRDASSRWPRRHAPLRDALIRILADERVAGHRCRADQLAGPLNDVGGGDDDDGDARAVVVDEALVDRAFGRCRADFCIPYANLGVEEGGESVLFARRDGGAGTTTAAAPAILTFGCFGSDIDGYLSADHPPGAGERHPLDEWDRIRDSIDVPPEVRSRLNAYLKEQRRRRARRKGGRKKPEKERRRKRDRDRGRNDRALPPIVEASSVPPRPANATPSPTPSPPRSASGPTARPERRRLGEGRVEGDVDGDFEGSSARDDDFAPARPLDPEDAARRDARSNSFDDLWSYLEDVDRGGGKRAAGSPPPGTAGRGRSLPPPKERGGRRDAMREDPPLSSARSSDRSATFEAWFDDLREAGSDGDGRRRRRCSEGEDEFNGSEGEDEFNDEIEHQPSTHVVGAPPATRRFQPQKIDHQPLLLSVQNFDDDDDDDDDDDSDDCLEPDGVDVPRRWGRRGSEGSAAGERDARRDRPLATDRSGWRRLLGQRQIETAFWPLADRLGVGPGALGNDEDPGGRSSRASGDEEATCDDDCGVGGLPIRSQSPAVELEQRRELIQSSFLREDEEMEGRSIDLGRRRGSSGLVYSTDASGERIDALLPRSKTGPSATPSLTADRSSQAGAGYTLPKSLSLASGGYNDTARPSSVEAEPPTPPLQSDVLSEPLSLGKRDLDNEEKYNRTPDSFTPPYERNPQSSHGWYLRSSEQLQHRSRRIADENWPREEDEGDDRGSTDAPHEGDWGTSNEGLGAKNVVEKSAKAVLGKANEQGAEDGDREEAGPFGRKGSVDDSEVVSITSGSENALAGRSIEKVDPVKGGKRDSLVRLQGLAGIADGLMMELKEMTTISPRPNTSDANGDHSIQSPHINIGIDAPESAGQAMTKGGGPPFADEPNSGQRSNDDEASYSKSDSSPPILHQSSLEDSISHCNEAAVREEWKAGGSIEVDLRLKADADAIIDFGPDSCKVEETREDEPTNEALDSVPVPNSSTSEVINVEKDSPPAFHRGTETVSRQALALSKDIDPCQPTVDGSPQSLILNSVLEVVPSQASTLQSDVDHLRTSADGQEIITSHTPNDHLYPRRISEFARGDSLLDPKDEVSDDPLETVDRFQFFTNMADINLELSRSERQLLDAEQEGLATLAVEEKKDSSFDPHASNSRPLSKSVLSELSLGVDGMYGDESDLDSENPEGRLLHTQTQEESGMEASGPALISVSKLDVHRTKGMAHGENAFLVTTKLGNNQAQSPLAVSTKRGALNDKPLNRVEKSLGLSDLSLGVDIMYADVDAKDNFTSMAIPPSKDSVDVLASKDPIQDNGLCRMSQRQRRDKDPISSSLVSDLSLGGAEKGLTEVERIECHSRTDFSSSSFSGSVSDSSDSGSDCGSEITSSSDESDSLPPPARDTLILKRHDSRLTIVSTLSSGGVSLLMGNHADAKKGQRKKGERSKEPPGAKEALTYGVTEQHEQPATSVSTAEGEYGKDEEPPSSTGVPSTDKEVDGATYFRRGKRKANKCQFLQAVARYNLALVRQREELGENHIDCGTTLHEIGVCWMMLGERHPALTAFEEALYIRQRELGDGAMEVAETTNKIWMILHEEAHFDRNKS
ncbi:hypothetical protein ACHAWF_015172 [Thalassiosira exigua]